MYIARGFQGGWIGDVDVLHVDGTFHLFHLVLPNHDYIAHAVSADGLNWKRVRNALFIGHPGSWDDDMLWTMHVTPDPHHEGQWRMFYCGLSTLEEGRIQRIGLARSSDLHHWTKEADGFPLEAGDAYESSLDEGRAWVSFRDPYYLEADGTGYLLAAARVKTGPLIRRGCVALLAEEAPDRFALRPPLYWPRLYDDIEVPVLFQIDGHWYLLGSIREDLKVHYWYTEALGEPFRNPADNVLLPQGNYAARVCRVGDRVLVWNFYFSRRTASANDSLLPPPKEIVRDDDGALRLRSYWAFDDKVEDTRDVGALTPLEPLSGNPEADSSVKSTECWFGSSHAFEAFLLQGAFSDFRLGFRLEMKGRGKCGIVLRMNDDGDGYYLSLDLINGLAQVRAWGTRPGGTGERAFNYRQLQSANFRSRAHGPYDVEIVATGRYLELSIDGFVVLSLADGSYTSGRAGFYVESSWIRVERLKLDIMRLERAPDYARVV